MFKIALIDDQMNSLYYLEKHITASLINHKIDYKIYKYNNSKEFFENDIEDINLVFLDIEINGESGITIAREMYNKKLQSIIIFVTAHDCYMQDAFGLNVFGYILKQEIATKVPKMIKNVINDLNNKTYIILSVDRECLTFNYHEIIYFSVEDRKYFIKTTSGIFEFQNISLKNLQNQLGKQFLQPNSKYLINIKVIKFVQGGNVVLINGETIKVSRGKIKKFNEVYKNALIDEVSRR